MSGAVPKLRFDGFDGAWKAKPIKSRLDKVIDYRGKAPPKTESGVPLITARNVRMGRLDFTADEYIDVDLYESWMNRGKPQSGDVLFTTEAPLANVCLFPDEGEFALGQRIITLRADATQLEGGFLYQFLLSEKGQSEVDFRSTGSTAKGIKSKVFVQIPFAAPTLPEQQKIAAFLGSVDSKLAALRRKQAGLERFKAGLMQRLFSQELRFTQDDGSAFPDWKEKRLGDVAEVNPRVGPLPNEFFYIDLESVTAGKLSHPKWLASEDAPSRAQRVLSSDDILFQMVRPYQRNNLHFKLAGQYVGSTGYAQLRANCNSDFLYQVLHTDDFVNKVIERCTGTGYPAINSSDLANIATPLPHPDEQRKIADALTALDAKIAATAAQITKTERFKQGLLQQMFV